MVSLPLEQFAARTKDAKILRHSSSGGMAVELSRCILRRGGVVFGAAFAGDFSVEHICVEDEKNLQRISGSKYCVSRVGPVFKTIEKHLWEKRDVLFFGTPCQAAAVRKRFGSNERLYICAIFCHSNVPGEIWKGYLKDLEKSRKSRVTNVVFRDMTSGWNEPTIRVSFEDETKNIIEPLYSNEYMQLFFSGWATQESCFHCAFRNGQHGADLMIGDFWGVGTVLPDWNDNLGVSAVLVYTQKGRKLFDALGVTKQGVTYGEVLAGNPGLEASPATNVLIRNRFQSVYRLKGVRRSYRYAKYGPIPLEMCKRGKTMLRALVGNLLRKVGVR